jgi:hypothetical protein
MTKFGGRLKSVGLMSEGPAFHHESNPPNESLSNSPTTDPSPVHGGFKPKP